MTDLIARANRSAGGARWNWRRSVVPKYVLATTTPDDSILDFGAGPRALHTHWLRKKGRQVTAYDFGGNLRDGVHDPHATDCQYTVVFASNVLNVQGSHEMLRHTLAEMWECVVPRGRLVVNYARAPRYLPEIKTADITSVLRDALPCAIIKRVNHEGYMLLWEATKLDS